MWHRFTNGEKTIEAGVNVDSRISKELKKLTGGGAYTAEDIWKAHRNVYESIGQKDWAEAVYEAYVKPLGICY